MIRNIRNGCTICGLIFALLLSGCATSNAETVGQTEETVSVSLSVEEPEEELREEPDECAGLIQDVNVIKTTLQKSILSDYYDEKPFEKLIEDIQNDRIDRVTCYYRLADIFADYNCAHLYIRTCEDLEEEICSTYFPIGIKRLDGEYYIISTVEQYKEYVGMKIVSFGNVPVTEANEKLAGIWSVETENARGGMIESYITLFPVLKETLSYCNLLDEEGKLVVGVENKEGFFDSFTMTDISMDEDCEWIKLTNNHSEYDISHFSGKNYCFRGDEENGIMYFEYFSCYEQEESFESCFSSMMKEITESENYNTIIFNVRDNTGGNRFLAREMLIRYQKELDPLQKYVVIGKNTASAGQHFIEDCLDFLPDIKIYGEETGQAIENFTEINQINLDTLGGLFTYPTLSDHVPFLESRAEDTKKGVMPDVYVVQTYEDYLEGIDTVYAQIVESIRTK